MPRSLFHDFNKSSPVQRVVARGATALVTIITMASGAHAQDQNNPTVLDRLTISGDQGTDEKKDSETVTAKSSAGATKIKTPLIETPRSISVITRKELDERGAQEVHSISKCDIPIKTKASPWRYLDVALLFAAHPFRSTTFASARGTQSSCR
ncbi:hypothetical protein Q1M64_32435 [Sinorhizobium meliloti]|nr:hypothetical protein LZK74_32195 [Sinorhizobium meliloti]WKL26259.1 hypothetical protein Q1M63_34070 [Sinorhizobium meliloti]WKL31212.1 hypothetical protein Q1M65_31390 [Sinorhizobium meliloti]WKL36906.1 hypothetical protein Q1M62_30950 [Sinorhizobium meliloti]WKL41168.1 hypothetical protein Q1M64_32435 [Sinorhizobium meliloti]